MSAKLNKRNPLRSGTSDQTHGRGTSHTSALNLYAIPQPCQVETSRPLSLKRVGGARASPEGAYINPCPPNPTAANPLWARLPVAYRPTLERLQAASPTAERCKSDRYWPLSTLACFRQEARGLCLVSSTIDHQETPRPVLSHRHAPPTQPTEQAWSAHVLKPRRTDDSRCFVVPIDLLEIFIGCLLNPYSRNGCPLQTR
jgi:hypothetical protein